MKKYADIIKSIKTGAKASMPLPGGATLYTVDIPRRMAQEILNNPHPQQRKLQKAGLHITRLINLMDSNEWNPLASDAMHFDPQGRCLQGQHRLTALVESKKGDLLDQLVIVHASDDAAMAVAQLLDQSLRTRNIADAGRMGGNLTSEEANRTLLSAVVLNRLGFDFGMFKLLPVTRRANLAVEMRNDERELFDRTVELFTNTPKLRSKALLSAAIECMRKDNGSGNAYEFFHAVGNLEPAIKGEFSPQANLLISYLRDGKKNGNKGGEAKEREDIYRCIRYYNAWRRGEEFDKNPPYTTGKKGVRSATAIPTPVA
jgi:hypothetical protein